MVPMGIFTITQTGQAMFGISRSGGYIAVVFEDNPDAGVPGVHTVVSGDTLSRIAARCKVTVDRLMKENPWIKKADRIYPRQKIVVVNREDSCNPQAHGRFCPHEFLCRLWYTA